MTMANRSCRKGQNPSGNRIAPGIGIAAGWAFLMGLSLGLAC